jgi:hypothetical protein
VCVTGIGAVEKGRKIFDMKICKQGSVEKKCVDGNKI